MREVVWCPACAMKSSRCVDSSFIIGTGPAKNPMHRIWCCCTALRAVPAARMPSPRPCLPTTGCLRWISAATERANGRQRMPTAPWRWSRIWPPLLPRWASKSLLCSVFAWLASLRPVMRAGTRHQAQLAKLVIVDIAPEIDAQGLKNIQSNVARSDVFNTRSEAFARARADNPRPPADHHRYRVDYSLMRTEDGRWTYCYDRALRDRGNRRESVPAEAGWQMVAFRTFL